MRRGNRVSSTVYLHFTDGETELELSRLHKVFFGGMTTVSRPRSIEAHVLLTTVLLVIVEGLVEKDTGNRKDATVPLFIQTTHIHSHTCTHKNMHTCKMQ